MARDRRPSHRLDMRDRNGVARPMCGTEFGPIGPAHHRSAARLLCVCASVPHAQCAGPLRFRFSSVRHRSGHRSRVPNPWLRFACAAWGCGLGIFSQILAMHVYKRELWKKRYIFNFFSEVLSMLDLKTGTDGFTCERKSSGSNRAELQFKTISTYQYRSTFNSIANRTHPI